MEFNFSKYTCSCHLVDSRGCENLIDTAHYNAGLSSQAALQTSCVHMLATREKDSSFTQHEKETKQNASCKGRGRRRLHKTQLQCNNAAITADVF